jgi:hypothetical protein
MLTTNLIAKFCSYYQRTRLIALSISTFATLGIASGTKDLITPRKSTQHVVCLCRESYMFKDYLYVNYSLWQPN